jgi:predicted peptidase
VGQRYLLRGDNAAHLAKMQVNYLLYLPPEYEPSRPWPLVVYLHSHGLEGDNLAYVLTEGLPHEIERGRQFPFILVSPQQPGQGGWNPELVLELTDHISSTLPIDRDRVYLTGGSMGGFATWDVASHYPDRFAALVPVCGGGDPLLAKRLVNVPIWAFHGAKDNVVPIAWDQRMVDAVKKCGGQVKFTVYPDLGHGIGDVTYENDELFKWLLAQRRGPRQQRSPAAAKERKMP